MASRPKRAADFPVDEFPPGWVKEVNDNWPCKKAILGSYVVFHFSTEANRDAAKAFLMLIGINAFEKNWEPDPKYPFPLGAYYG